MDLDETMTSRLEKQEGQYQVYRSAAVLSNYCHGVARECGWWENTTEKEVPRLLMLTVSELSEAMEGHRKNLMDTHLPDRKMLEVELADAAIRIFDMAGGLKLDIAGAIVEKMLYNTTREDHKPEVRAAGGKAY